MRTFSLAATLTSIVLLPLLGTVTARELEVMPDFAPLLQPPPHSSHYTSISASRHRALRAEPRDEPWATAMELRLRRYLESIDTSSEHELEVSVVACRTTLCEVRAVARGGDLTEQFAFQEVPARMVRTDFATDLSDASISILLGDGSVAYAVFFVRTAARAT